MSRLDRTSVCVCVCARVCIVFFCACVCIHVYIYVWSPYTCVYICMESIHTYIQPYTHIYMNYIHTCTQTYAHTYIHIRLRWILHIHAYRHTHIHTYIHIRLSAGCLAASVHTYIHAYTHTHVHTYISDSRLATWRRPPRGHWRCSVGHDGQRRGTLRGVLAARRGPKQGEICVICVFVCV